MADSGSFNSDDQLVIALASGRFSVKQAACDFRVSERTIYRRLSEPAFRKRVEEIRRYSLENSISKLSAGAILAAQTMLDLLKSDAPPATRLAASRAILEFGSRLRETNDLDVRLCALEDRNNG
jgi:hypothetical protein